MDRETVAVYQERAGEWAERRGDTGDGLGRRFRSSAGPDLVADLGCGTGRYLPEIGAPVVGVDATGAMLRLARGKGQPLVQADLEALPLAAGTLAGAFARHSYLHVPKRRMPAALAELHRVLAPGAEVWITVIEGDYEGHRLPEDDFPGRYFACWTPDELTAALRSAGFGAVRTGREKRALLARARR